MLPDREGAFSPSCVAWRPRYLPAYPPIGRSPQCERLKKIHFDRENCGPFESEVDPPAAFGQESQARDKGLRSLRRYRSFLTWITASFIIAIKNRQGLWSFRELAAVSELPSLDYSPNVPSLRGFSRQPSCTLSQIIPENNLHIISISYPIDPAYKKRAVVAKQRSRRPMPATASTVDSGRPSRSASAIMAKTESGQHMLKVDGYSRTKVVNNGSHIRSRSFLIGGHTWHIEYYPNGFIPPLADNISFFLRLDDIQDMRAQYTFSLLDRVGKPVPSYTQSSNEGHGILLQGLGFMSLIKKDELEKSEHLRDDCFTVRFDVTVIKEFQTEEVDVATPPVVAVPASNLHQLLGGLLAAGDGADVVFEVDGKMLTAHRYVLAARSSVFREELFGPTRESATTNVIRIDDMEAQDFEALLYFIYTDSLPQMKEEEEAAMLPDLIAAANRYNMERLRLICEDKLCEYVDVSTVAIILAFAEQHHCHGLKEACLEFLNHPANLRAVMATDGLEHLSKSCPSVLKELITKLAAAP